MEKSTSSSNLNLNLYPCVEARPVASLPIKKNVNETMKQIVKPLKGRVKFMKSVRSKIPPPPPKKRANVASLACVCCE